MRQMAVNLAGVELKNPVMTASGTFGSGAEYGEMVDLNKLGAVVTKGVANVPWPGNPTPRIAEVYGGMINAIGLQNPGYDLFASRDIPFLRQYDTKIIVNVCGKTAEDYVDVVEKLASQPVDMLEINISCPNVKEGGIAFGQDPKAVEAITREVKRHAKQPIIMKLSPNVTDITEMAKAAEAGGADVLSLINTLTGMKIDINGGSISVSSEDDGINAAASTGDETVDSERQKMEANPDVYVRIAGGRDLNQPRRRRNRFQWRCVCDRRSHLHQWPGNRRRGLPGLQRDSGSGRHAAEGGQGAYCPA